jgi:hypothetical protein
MWINQRNAVSDEQQDPDQELENRFRLGGMVIQKLINCIYKHIDCI